MTKRFLIMAGGTGGHVFPGLAVAKQLEMQGHEVQWLGTPKGMESDLVPKHGYKVNSIEITGLRGKGKLALITAPFKLMKAVFQAWSIIRNFKPDAVLGMGGFVTGPGGVAAKLAGVPLIIHEQNAIPGLTNRLLSKIANLVLEAFPNTFDGQKVKTVGNPVRKEIVEITRPDERISMNEQPLKILVVGGSLGAKALNDIMPQVVATLPEKTVVVRHQTGRGHFSDVAQMYDGAKNHVEIIEFVDDMAEAMAWADLLICRSGALTVTEIMTAGVASILVPFPYAVDDHQTKNGESLSKSGAAKLIQQNELSVTWLEKEILELQKNREKILAMALKARSLSLPDSTEKVANYFMAIS